MLESGPSPTQGSDASSKNQHRQFPRDGPPLKATAQTPMDMSSPIENSPAPSISLQDLAKRRSQVFKSRIKLRESRTLLQLKKKRIDKEEDGLLPALREAAAKVDIDQLKAAIESLQKLVEWRDCLRPDEEAQEQLEEQLLDEDTALTELESKFYAGGAASISSSFPGGGLDFTGQGATAQDMLSASTSVFSEPPPEKQEYDIKLGEVNSIRERLMDLQSEHDQLLREKEMRLRVGLTLDTYSLDFLDRFDDDFSSLSLRLDEAEDGLMLAEANWTNRRRVLEQPEDPFVSAEPASGPMDMFSSRLSELSLADDYDFYENKDTSTQPMDLVDNELSQLVTSILEPEDGLTFAPRVPSSDLNGQTVNMARFINQWLLQRMQQIPEEAVRFMQSLIDKHVSIDASNMAEVILSGWTQDGLEEEFIVQVEAGEHSFTGSLAPNNGVTRILAERAQSHRLRHSPQRSQRITRSNVGRLAKTGVDGLT